MFQIEGYSDLYNLDKTRLVAKTLVVESRKYLGTLNAAKTLRTYTFTFIPNCGFLNSNLPLINNSELKLSFDRVNSDVALIAGGSPTESISGTAIDIKDCYAITEYVSSESMRSYFNKIDTTPIPYVYEECEITLKTLPLNEKDIRLDNIKGGNNPGCMFVGLIPTDAVNGSMTKSATGFHHHGVESINITLNGNSVNGYPVDMRYNSCVTPFRMFNEVTNRYMNPLTGDSMDLNMFSLNWLYSHKFEAEATPQGWLGVHLKLTTGLNESYTLVIWTINKSAITIDKFHQIEKLIL